MRNGFRVRIGDITKEATETITLFRAQIFLLGTTENPTWILFSACGRIIFWEPIGGLGSKRASCRSVELLDKPRATEEPQEDCSQDETQNPNSSQLRRARSAIHSF